MIGRPQRGVVGTWPVEAHAALLELEGGGNPDVVDTAIHSWPIRMRYGAIAVREWREGRRTTLCGLEAAGHQRCRGRFDRRVEVAADDARRHVVAFPDPGQKPLHLVKPERILAARHVEMRDVD